MSAQIVLVEASPRRAADGVTETVRLAGGGARLPYYYDGAHWQSGVVRLPVIVAALEFSNGDFGSGSVPQAAEIEWAPANSSALDALAGYMWRGASVSVRIGPEGSYPPIVISGRVLNCSVADGRLKIALSDPAAALKVPVLTEKFGGTGGLDGPADWEGQIKRRVWGRVWNVPAMPIDPANNVWCLSDPARPIHAIDSVRDKGATAASLTMLGWQGSMAATFTALQEAETPQGGGVVCPSIACLKWWTNPAGDLTADLRGETGAGYVETTAEIAQRIVALAEDGPDFAAGEITAATGSRPAAIGWMVDNGSSTIAETLSAMLGNVSLLWLLTADRLIRIREWSWSAPVAEVKFHKASRVESYTPTRSRRIGYRRNELPMARGSLAAIVLYEDGTTLDDLRPAQAGADVTIENTSASIVGQGALAVQNSADWTSQVIGTGKPDDNADVTGVNTAAAITGQGALATQNSANWASQVIGTGKPDDYADVTGVNTAAAITGQGALATKNNADWTADVAGTGKPDDYATNADNLIINSDMAANASGWSLSNTSRFVAGAGTPIPAWFYFPSGTSGTASANNAAPRPIGDGTKLFGSCYANRQSGASGSMVVDIYWYKADGNFAVAVHTAVSISPSVADAWERQTFVVNRPVDATHFMARFDVSLSGNYGGAGGLRLGKTQAAADVTIEHTAAAITNQSPLAAGNSITAANAQKA
ncbi:MAG: hypothetical protein ACK5NN_00185, partial [Sphingomonadaceae bacterium]